MTYQGRTKVSELQDLIRKFGGTPRADTIAELQDELEHAIGSGGSSDEALIRAVVEQCLQDQEPATITDGDMDDIFGDPQEG